MSHSDAGGENICPNPTLLPTYLAPTVVAVDPQCADSDDDRALRGISSPHFQLAQRTGNISGVREVFEIAINVLVPSGATKLLERIIYLTYHHFIHLPLVYTTNEQRYL